MSRIKVLSETLQNKIAAGEVIERPASIVKELIENAIDAESSDIRIEIIKGGKKLLKVDDDGIGMNREDALLCFQKHATSKIRDEDDLSTITTMGFRGEALSSIASVAKITIKTTPRNVPEGTSVEISGGEIQAVKDIAIVGTTIEVRDLFFNTPVRKKFLKTDYTEQYHIIDTVTRMAIIYPETSFSLRDVDRVLMNLPKASDMRERIVQLFGVDFLEGLTAVSGAGDRAGISLEGFVSKPGNVRKKRSNQYLFVNRRPVIDVSIRHAIYRAFEGLSGNDAHPLYFLHVMVDPGDIDVNVHPTKREIRLLEKENIYNFFLESISEAIRRNSAISERSVHAMPRTASEEGALKTSQERGLYEKDVQIGEVAAVSEAPEFSYSVDNPFLYVGDVFVAYADREGLCIVDHHAAHERILYEKYRANRGVSSSGLLFPKQIRLGAKEYSVLLRYKDVLYAMGFELDDFGGNTVLVRSIPEGISEQELDSLLNDVASSIMDFKSSSPVDDVRDQIAKMVACHKSVRGRVILGKEKIAQLLRDLDKTEDPHHCPHGRPTRTYFSLDDLRKLFERK